jgi:ABC-type uncharacterized transport system involved in gliding motility auxiliary subunit
MKQNPFETLIYSGVGLVVMFVVLISFNVVASAVKVRYDVTADKAHTLSPGTKHVLSKIKSRVTIRFYCTQGDNAMPPPLRTYAQHIEDLLAEYQQAAQGKINIQKLDPKPDSDVEDSARLNGVEGQATGPFGANKIYLGIVVSIFDQKFVLPWLPPDRERLLEYDISRAIARVVNGTPPTVGVMTAMPVWGQQYNPMTMSRDARGQDPWAFVSELKKDFNVQPVPMTASKIDDSIKVLLVMHPRNITDETQYAIDQFLMRGGKLLAFIDPHAFFDESHESQMQAFQVVGENAYGQSTLDKLLKAWGLNMDINKVAADETFASRNARTGDVRPTILAMTASGIDHTDVATAQIDNLILPFAGVFTGKPADGLNEAVLVKCSTNSQLVDSLVAATANEQIMRDFKPEGIEYPLAVHLTGKFKTAFPGGSPSGSDPGQIKESTGVPEVVLVGDTDMLNDKVCVRTQDVMGHRVIHPMNGNLNFLQSVVELFSGDDDLISSRSRASISRPFTRLQDMEATAGKQWEEKIRVLEAKQHEMERMISALQTHKEGGSEEKLILSPEQEQELENYQETRVQASKDLKEVRRNLRKDTDALEFWTKVVNIGAMPVVVACSGFALAIVKINRKRKAKK